MTTDWLEAFPRTVKPILDEIDEVLQCNLTKIIAEGPNSLLTATENTEPAIMATSIMILRVLEQEFGFKTEETVDITLGHSLGEFAALVAGGYLRETNALKTVRRRAEVVARVSKEARETHGDEVGMIALVTEADRRDSFIDAIHEFLGHSSPGAKSDFQRRLRSTACSASIDRQHQQQESDRSQWKHRKDQDSVDASETIWRTRSQSCKA